MNRCIIQTEGVTIRAKVNNKTANHSLQNTNACFIVEGKPKADLQNFFDVDISLMPFTNTLPINRLKLKTNELTVIKVPYFDIPENKTSVLKQIYTKRKNGNYLFENFDKSFKAKLKVD